MKLIVSLSEVESLLRNHYRLNGGDRIVISRPRKVGKISTLTLKVPEDIQKTVNLIDSFVRDRQTIAAIKEYRAVTHLGLKEAKDAIEAWTSTKRYILEHGHFPNP